MASGTKLPFSTAAETSTGITVSNSGTAPPQTTFRITSNGLYMISYDLWFYDISATRAYVYDGVTETAIPGTFMYNDIYYYEYEIDDQTQITFLLRVNNAPVDFYVENAAVNILQDPTASNFVRTNITITRIGN